MKVISLASTICDRETETVILTVYLKNYLKVFENRYYFMKELKYKYFLILKCQIQV